MLEFKVIQELKPNTQILEIIKSYNYITKNGKVKHLTNTNLQFVEPTEYIITYPTTLTYIAHLLLNSNHLLTCFLTKTENNKPFLKISFNCFLNSFNFCNLK